VRLVGIWDPGCNGRGHFFAATAMRRILINWARDRGRLKRGGDRSRVNLENLRDPFEAPDAGLLDLDGVLDRLARAYPRPAELVKMRFFAGMSLADAAAPLGISTRTADREWMFARACLRNALGPE
jgi:RNA polymerase sigma factor (TIGR02999 family)